MPEETATTEQPTSAETDKNTGSAGATQQQEPSGTQAGTTEDKPKTFTQADIDRAAVAARRDEKARLEKQIKQAELSEAEKLKAENAELQTKLRSRDAEDSIVAACGKDCVNPKAVVRLAHSIGLEFDKDGKLTNLKDLIAEAKDIAPELFPKRPGPANGGDGNGTSPVGQSMNDVIRQAAGRK